MSREPEVVQAETELPHQLWNICFQGRQQGPGWSYCQGLQTCRLDCLSAVYPQLIGLHSGQCVEQTCHQPLVPGFTAFWSKVERFLLSSKQLSNSCQFREGCKVPLLQSRTHLKRKSSKKRLSLLKTWTHLNLPGVQTEFKLNCRGGGAAKRHLAQQLVERGERVHEW